MVTDILPTLAPADPPPQSDMPSHAGVSDAVATLAFGSSFFEPISLESLCFKHLVPPLCKLQQVGTKTHQEAASNDGPPDPRVDLVKSRSLVHTLQRRNISIRIAKSWTRRFKLQSTLIKREPASTHHSGTHSTRFTILPTSDQTTLCYALSTLRPASLYSAFTRQI